MQGIDEFKNQESIFYSFTRGTTLPYTFTLFEEDGVTPIDVTNWQVWLSFSPTKDSQPPEFEVSIPIQDAVNGVFSGYIEDDDTFNISAGTIFASARYIRDDGRAFVFDKAKIKVYEGVSPRRA